MSRGGGGGGRQLCSNDIYFIRKFRLADVSKHPDSSYFLCFCVCLMLNACHLTVIAFAAIKQPQRQGLDFETPTRDDERPKGRTNEQTKRTCERMKLKKGRNETATASTVDAR